jgi:hypothetical protein
MSIPRKLDRTAFTRSRAAEYFDAKELAAQTGQPISNFAMVVVKELVDNALDACETSEVAPKIGIEVAAAEGRMLRITVNDNAGGIPADVVEKTLDYSIRVSDKAAYRSPTRGAQGNALKTIVGIPHALGSPEPVIIEGGGYRHEIRAWIDPAGELRIEPERTPSEASGTSVSLTLPFGGQDCKPDHWGAAFGVFNPHTTIEYDRRGLTYEGNYQGDSDRAKGGIFSKTYKSSVVFPGGQWRKYLPRDLTSPHWYTPDSLKQLIFAHIADARNGGRDLPLGEFIRDFRGLSSPSKAKAVKESIPAIGKLSHFESFPSRGIPALHAAMIEHSKEPSHDIMGVVGEDHFRHLYDVEEFTYKKVKGHFPNGLPYVFEFALAVTEEPGYLYTGINFSPTFGDPLEGTTLIGPKFRASGLRGFLSQGHALPKSDYSSYSSPADVAAAAHIVTPAPVFLDRGKTRLQIEES